MKNKFDLEERLITFSVKIIELVHSMPDRKISNHLGGQLLRSGTSPALNYGEAQSGESSRDFIHKLKVILKELRETSINLKIIERANLFNSKEELTLVLSEVNELISIFVKSVQTAENNQSKR